MHRPFSWFLGKSREPDIAISVKEKTHDRGKNANTYAFLISIVTGNDYKQPRNVEALALYNESCTCNYISARFARDQLQILDEPGKDIESDCTLVWVCKSLGRYKQRSIFWIAPNADFDLLFGEEDEFNTRSHEDSQFNLGIESGILSEVFPEMKPRKSFQGGINDEFLLPVERLNAGDSSRRSQMPSLADIKVQLAAQLDCTLERRLKHKRERALNIWNPHFVISSEELRPRGGDEETTKPTLTALEVSESPRTDEVDRTVRRSSIDLDNGLMPKGKKRSLPDEHTTLSTDMAGCCPRSPKLRNVRERPMSTHLPLDHQVGNVLGGVSWNSDVPHYTETECTITELKSEPIPEGQQEIIEGTQRLRSFVGSIAEEILFSGMDRECSPDHRNSHESSSISLSPHEPCIFSGSEAVVPQPKFSRDLSAMTKKSEKRSKRKRRSKRKLSKSRNVGDWIDKKFNEFWTSDEEVGNWYHFDESTNKKIWYEPPPLD